MFAVLTSQIMLLEETFVTSVYRCSLTDGQPTTSWARLEGRPGHGPRNSLEPGLWRTVAFTPSLSPATTPRSRRGAQVLCQPWFLLDKADPRLNDIDLSPLKLPSLVSWDFCLQIPFLWYYLPESPYRGWYYRGFGFLKVKSREGKMWADITWK